MAVQNLPIAIFYDSYNDEIYTCMANRREAIPLFFTLCVTDMEEEYLLFLIILINEFNFISLI